MLLLLFTGYSVPARKRSVLLPPDPAIAEDESECLLALAALFSATAHGAPTVDQPRINDE